MKKPLIYGTALVFVLLFVYLLPRVALFYFLCGVYDVSRNKPFDLRTVQRYFTGNGLLTWLLSPFNVVMDILSLPYINKGVYRLEDLPKPYQDEITQLIASAHDEDLVGKLEERTRDSPRTMIFFKWYGSNVDNTLEIPAFRRDYRYIRTIGVSVFRERESTSKHFGPFRATLRVLYNLNTMDDYSAYIQVGDVKNYWKDNKLFIFDDTLLHQSFNESSKPRYCLFVDILRPALLPALLASVVGSIRFFLRGVNYVFYKNWKVIKT